MTYTVTDIAELIRHHLVLSEETDERADANLAQLMRTVAEMVSSAPAGACHACRVWITAAQVGPDGAGVADDGNFYCRACRLMETATAEATWVFCDRCGASVDTVLIHPDGHRYSEDGDFYCSDCWEQADSRSRRARVGRPRAMPRQDSSSSVEASSHPSDSVARSLFHGSHCIASLAAANLPRRP